MHFRAEGMTEKVSPGSSSPKEQLDSLNILPSAPKKRSCTLGQMKYSCERLSNDVEKLVRTNYFRGSFWACHWKCGDARSIQRNVARHSVNLTMSSLLNLRFTSARSVAGPVCGFSRSFTQGFSPSFTHPRVLFLSF